jgi:hypothetical protein
MRLGRMEDMAERILYVEAEDAITALRERGIGGSAARRAVQEALAAADGPDPGAVFRLYALAAAVAGVAAFLAALL